MDFWAEYPLTGKAGEGLFTLVDLDIYAWLNGRRLQLTPQGYVQVNSNEMLHRHVLGLNKGDGWHVDHMNRDRLDNRRRNLRRVSQAENNQNMAVPGGPRTRGTTRHKRDRRWQAQARLDGKHIHLGYYETREEAFVEAEKFRILHYPGFISEDPELEKRVKETLVMGGERAHEVPAF